MNDEEKRILQLMADGYAVVDVAYKLDMTKNQLDKILLHLRIKHDVSNTTGLIVKALREKEIV